MNLKKLLDILSDNDCKKVYVKRLSANDNSKNQVYLGSSFDILNILPIKEISADSDNRGGGRKTRFKTKLDFFWINELGETNVAPDAQLILYPKYPEVRFSGFLKGCRDAPSELMVARMPDRLLFMGVSKAGQVLSYVVEPMSELANEFAALRDLEDAGVFKKLTIVGNRIELDSKGKLLHELKRINALGWINSKRLDSGRVILPCNSTNCGGYTLEAELGITPNGSSDPDYLGWEVKQFAVKNFKEFGTTAITLMTPEPTNGIYVDEGVEAFIRKYGYNDKLGREARMNFGGVHKYGIIQASTQLKMVLVGYDKECDEIEDTNGYMGLTDDKGNIAAAWSFTSLLKHWNTKHANACYVPSLNRKTLNEISSQQYAYGDLIMLGRNTDFSIFLKQVADGHIYYDPGIKLELAIPDVRTQYIKRRSQFRIKASKLTSLYKDNEIVCVKDVD